MMGRKICMTLSERTMDLLDRLAAEKGVKKSAIVSLAVAEYAADEERKNITERGKVAV